MPVERIEIVIQKHQGALAKRDFAIYISVVTHRKQFIQKTNTQSFRQQNDNNKINK